MDEQREKRNRRLGVLISVGTHVLLLLAFMFILAWREPDPPLPEYGIEINFGLDQQGSGEIQPETPVNPDPVEETQEPAESPETEEVETETETEAAETEEVVEQAEEITEPVEETAPEQPVTNTQESPEVVKEQEKQEPKPVTKPETKPVEQPKKTETREEEKKPAAPATQTTQPSEQEQPSKASEGDDKDVPGDKGEPEGELNPDAVYKGKPGGGSNGPALNIIGWIWDEVPNKKDASNENGTVTFVIDEDGYVISTRTIQRSVSPSVAEFYEEQLRRTTFSRTGSGVTKPGNTKGTVTFNIVSR